jgi:hypothetical protein
MRVNPKAPTDAPLLTAEQFRGTPEFRKFKGIMRGILAVPKTDLDRMVQIAKKESPRAGNVNAAGRKPKASAGG